MENGEDFWLQVSTFGGSTYTTVATWVAGTDFSNNQRYNESVTLTSGFATASTRLRFRCDATANSDYVYIDDVVLSGCSNGTTQVVTSNNVANNDLIEDEIDSEYDLVEISIFPNPATDFINLNYLPESSKIELINISGQTLHEAFDQSRFNVSDLEAGIYMFRIYSDDESRVVKFIKR